MTMDVKEAHFYFEEIMQSDALHKTVGKALLNNISCLPDRQKSCYYQKMQKQTCEASRTSFTECTSFFIWNHNKECPKFNKSSDIIIPW